MFDALKRAFAELRRAQPGQRFQHFHEQRHAQPVPAYLRVLAFAGAWFVIVVGIIMMPAPGPGMLVVALGLAMLASVSQRAAKFLDRSELALRNTWQRLRR